MQVSVDSIKKNILATSVVLWGMIVCSCGIKLATLDTETEESNEGSAPSITSQNRSYFFEGKNSSFEITVTGTPIPSVTCEGNLPIGVNFEPSSRLLNGLPSFGSRGDYPLQLTARNGIQPDFTQDFTLTVLFSGSLDVSFGNEGKVTTAIGTGVDQAEGLALQTDGKIVVSGAVQSGSVIDFALVRYNPDGSLDNTFGTGGKVTTAFGTSAEVKGMVIQTDGKILVAGYRTENSNIDIALARYWP